MLSSLYNPSQHGTTVLYCPGGYSLLATCILPSTIVLGFHCDMDFGPRSLHHLLRMSNEVSCIQDGRRDGRTSYLPYSTSQPGLFEHAIMVPSLFSLVPMFFQHSFDTYQSRGVLFCCALWRVTNTIDICSVESEIFGTSALTLCAIQYHL